MITEARRKLLGRYHVLAGKLFGGDEDLRRAALMKLTGKNSAKDLTDGQLRSVCGHLQKAERELNKVSKQQWATLSALCFKRGWKSGFSDQRFLSFVEHTTGKRSAWALTNREASAVITGLQKWMDGGGAKEAKQRPNAHYYTATGETIH